MFLNSISGVLRPCPPYSRQLAGLVETLKPLEEISCLPPVPGIHDLGNNCQYDFVRQAGDVQIIILFMRVGTILRVDDERADRDRSPV